MLTRIKHLMSEHKTFAIETTLAARSYKALIKRAKSKGYIVVLLFLWLPSPEMAEQRVVEQRDSSVSQHIV